MLISLLDIFVCVLTTSWKKLGFLECGAIFSLLEIFSFSILTNEKIIKL
jgi:hypothetical protein